MTKSRPGGETGRRLARPYTMVGGRTVATGKNLSVEAQVLRTSEGERKLPSLLFERREILLLCSEPVSVAELAARMHVPLGVARVLIGDLVTDGLVNADNGTGAQAPDLILLEKVLHGLRAL